MWERSLLHVHAGNCRQHLRCLPAYRLIGVASEGRVAEPVPGSSGAGSGCDGLRSTTDGTRDVLTFGQATGAGEGGMGVRFEDFLRGEMPGLAVFAGALTGDHHLAEDVLSEALLLV